MYFQHALNPRRIARSIITILVLGFIQSVGAPILIPEVVAPKAEAVTVDYSGNTNGYSVVVPAGVFSVRITARGAAGGRGGDDGGSLGLAGSNVGSVEGTFAVKPGDRISIYPGGAGSDGAGHLSAAAGGSAGSTSLPTNSNTRTPAFKYNGTFSDQIIISGGAGGPAGTGGSSGGGGGGGAGSFVAINENVALVAGGAGGGGGGSGAGATAWNGTFVSNTVAYGATGINGGTCGTTDGAGSGGGGGGWEGGAAGAVTRPGGSTGECRGYGGSAGKNFVSNFATSSVDTMVTANGAGSITYVFTYDSLSSCTTNQQIVDIYTIVKVTKEFACTWSVPSTVTTVDLFLVGGGGGGAGDAGGGGGGGAGLSRTAVPVTPNTNLTLKVGYGGGGSGWGYFSNAYAGDSTTVQTSSGALYYALGGQTNGNAPGGAGGAGGVATNGAFSGGAGGAGGVCGSANSVTAASPGKTGTSNYFYGSITTYGGGGGGGTCPNNAVGTAAAGANGGGAGGYAAVANTNTMGGNANDNSGSGGGGGTASGTGLKLPGGKGGSGIILIRYVTDSANAFPAALASDVNNRFLGSDLQVVDSNRRGWVDSAGGIGSSVTMNGTTSAISTVSGNGSTKSLIAASGGTSDNITLSQLPAKYTLFHVARYSGASKARLITTPSSSANWLSGFYYGKVGTAHHNAWLTLDATNGATTSNWLLSSDQNDVYRANGENRVYRHLTTQSPYNFSTTTPITLGVNTYASEVSDWQVVDILIFKRELTQGEILQVEKYLALTYGLTLNTSDDSSDTDTAASFDASGSYWLGMEPSAQTNLNDTFTVEMWVNLGTECSAAVATRWCHFMATEAQLLLSVASSTFRYAMYGNNSQWEWIDTGVKIPSNEWHHFAFVKDGIGSTSGSAKLYLDGNLVYVKSGNPYRISLAGSGNGDTLYPGGTTSATYFGYRDCCNGEFSVEKIDEVRIYRASRSASQILADANTAVNRNDPTLQAYFDFNKNGTTSTQSVPNQAFYGNPGMVLLPTGYTIKYTDIKSVSTTGPYTVVTFPRSYYTSNGGWKAPDSVTAVSALIVGGGGGGGYNSGSGGSGGGFNYVGSVPISGNVTVTVGVGGIGALDSVQGSVPEFSPRDGAQSTFGTLTVNGGNKGSIYNSGSSSSVNSAIGVTTGSYTSGAGGAGSFNVGAGSAGGAGITSDITGSSVIYSAGGGGGSNSNSTVALGGGAANSGAGNGGGGSPYTGTNATANRGGGGGASSWRYNAGYGGSGVVIIRYITALKPTFTSPTNVILDLGQYETFTTNVAADSATAGLTRTFRWESSTAGLNGPYTVIKQGTGAANAAFSWLPSDSSTTGSQYRYRVIVTDSDTAGLFIQETSTSVYATFNPAMIITSTINNLTVKKTLNVARSETYTVTLGTPGYNARLTPSIPGVTVDTSTAGLIVLKISDTASVGSYAETLTVMDSTTFPTEIHYPLTINIQGPTSLTDNAEIVQNNLVLHLDAANRYSLTATDGALTTNVPWYDMSGAKKNASTSNTANSATCNPPAYSSDFGGILTFSHSAGSGTAGSTCYNTPYLGTQFTSGYTVETWIRPSATLLPSGYQILSQMYDTGGEQISLVVGDLDVQDGKIYVGFYSGNGWRYANCGITPVANTWMHIMGTYNGETLTTYLNGVSQCTGTYKLFGTINTKGYYIGKRWDSTYYFTGNIAAVRIYKVGLSSTQVLQNYNATKNRFDVSNQSIIKPVQKYGVLNIETFTVTSGGDTKTISFSTGNRTGIFWDTATAGLIKLNVQESLTPGTYYDTVTVTDNYGVATNLPIKFTINKADTITVYIDTPTALTYNGSQAAFPQTLKISGLVSSDTSTAATIKYKPGGTTCATGGSCAIGDIGPGGGIVFITPSTSGGNGKYFEVAPSNWSGSDDVSTVTTYCSNSTTSYGATTATIGWGDTNTSIAKTNCLGGAVAKVNAFNQSNTSGYSDWFIPTSLEMTELIKVKTQAGMLTLGSNWTSGQMGYWTSTEYNATGQRIYSTSGGVIASVSKSNSVNVMVRPVRMFSACWALDTCTSLATTTKPTNAGTYSVTPSALTLSVGNIANYEGVRYVATTATINKAAQIAQIVPFYNPNYPDTMTVNFGGGSGNGTQILTVVGGSATGCTLDYKKLYSTSAGTCNVQSVKNGDRNYLPDTVTAYIYFILFVNNQPNNGVGSGSTIVLNGQTSVTLDSTIAPTISGLSTYSASTGSSITITGAGFYFADSTKLVIKFWRNVVADRLTYSSYSDGSITVTIPNGATTGKVVIVTPNGIAVSEFPLAIV